MKPPEFYDTSFDGINTKDLNAIRARFETLVLHQLVAYLNQTVLSGIQPLRAIVGENPVSLDAFSQLPQRLRIEPEHWYIYNEGGRAEAQFNIGMSQDWMRIGLAFHMQDQRGGDSDKVKSALKEFRKATLNDKQAFEGFVKNNNIILQWTSEGGQEGNRKGTEISGFLENNTQELAWLFVGRFLRRGHDRQILESTDKLDATMRALFDGLWPYYEKAQYWSHGFTTPGKIPVKKRS